MTQSQYASLPLMSEWLCGPDCFEFDGVNLPVVVDDTEALMAHPAHRVRFTQIGDIAPPAATRDGAGPQTGPAHEFDAADPDADALARDPHRLGDMGLLPVLPITLNSAVCREAAYRITVGRDASGRS